MPALFVFLLKVNIALLLFCAGYYLVLRHLTFYTLNRVYLLTAILFASIYPQINLTDFLQRHEQLAGPMQRVVINWQAPAQALVQKVHQPAYWLYIEAVFWIGAVLLAIRLLVQLFSLYKLFKNSQPATIGNHNVRVMDNDAAPFSFWRSIFVNPAKHEPADLKAILLHEQVHVNQWHTADILLAELSSIFYWFNPGIWLMKRAIRENIEFITDQKILKKGIDSKAYQYSLVSVSFTNTQPGIVNHFNLSTIKKRIIMMNAKRSSKINLTRYAFMVPAVIGLLLVFSISKADFVKKSKAFKTITIISDNVGNAVGINKLTASIKSILPGADTTNSKTSTNAMPMVFENNFADAVFYLDGVQISSSSTGVHFDDDTESLDYIQAADAKKYFNIGDGKYMIAFGTRKNTAEGAALRNKIVGLVSAGKIRVNSIPKEEIQKLNGKIRAIDSDIASHLSADTLKKSKHFSIVTNSDSSLVYINGKKGKIKDVDPDDILSVNVFDAKGAAGFINEKVDDNTAVIFITTKNSAEGQKFKEKLDGYTGNNTAIAGAGVKGLNGMPLKGKVANVMVYNVKIDSKDSLEDNGSKGLRYTVNGISNVTAGNIKVLPGTLVMVKDSRVDKKSATASKLTLVKVTSKTTNSSGTNTPELILDDNENSGSATGTGTVNKVYVTARKANTLQLVKSNVTVNGIPLSDSVVVMSDQNAPKTTTSKWKISYRTDVDNDKASPLILVDGKEVNQAEFKKVNPSDIKNISILKNDAATDKKYGEKAKQGVIVIELKKKK